MSVMQRERSSTHQRNRIFFYDLNKIMKIKKKSKSNETNNDVPSVFSIFLPPFITFLCFFQQR